MSKILKIEIIIEEFDDGGLPEDERFVGVITEGPYANIVATGGSPTECVREIAISMLVQDMYITQPIKIGT